MSQNDQKPIANVPTTKHSRLNTMPHPSCGYARHGKPLRGLMATSRSSNFQGRFGRMFSQCSVMSATSYGADEAESRSALMALGDAMTAGPDHEKDGRDGEESGIPALYTYFGQFIDHDITFDPMTTLISHSDPDALTDFRTPALDLDNMYGRGPDDQPYMYDSTGTKFLLGKPLDNNAFDLPRNNATPARAIIGDPRNDENTIISQFQGLMLTFHNRVAEDHPHLDFRSIQKIVRWHYQWVVINDFLTRIVAKNVIESLKTNGQYDQSKIKFYRWKNNPFMPVEFSAAAYRLGHSMIRPGYRMNDTVLVPIFANAAQVEPGSLAGFQAVAHDHGIDWQRFIDIGPPRPQGDEPPPGQTIGDSVQQQRLQFAYRLDTSIVNPLSVLPPSVAPDEPRSLAQRNLLRGFELGLPTGQDVARAMGVIPLTDEEILIGKKLDLPLTGDDTPPVPISEQAQLEVFRGKCPLWTYILAEAMYNAQPIDIPVEPAGTQVTTPQLGEVGGRIVAEVFLGMLFGDSDSFLSRDPAWVPTIGADPGKVNKDFKLKDIVHYATTPKAAAKTSSRAAAGN
jgi:hypothetical protein